MTLIQRCGPLPTRLGILPGSFNPPTRAHVALARAALDHVDEVLFVLPAVFPHKQYEGATLEQRIEMLRRVTEVEQRFAVALSERGLFIDIAGEAREHYPDSRLFFLCGRDAAERIVGWDYGEPGAIERMLEVFHLLVAPRGGVYTPPPHLTDAVHSLSLPDYDECSATRVRERPWDRALVPEEIAEMVARIYG